MSNFNYQHPHYGGQPPNTPYPPQYPPDPNGGAYGHPPPTQQPYPAYPSTTQLPPSINHYPAPNPNPSPYPTSTYPSYTQQQQQQQSPYLQPQLPYQQQQQQPHTTERYAPTQSPMQPPTPQPQQLPPLQQQPSPYYYQQQQQQQQPYPPIPHGTPLPSSAFPVGTPGWMEAISREAREAFYKADCDCSGYLDVQEFYNVIRSLVGSLISYQEALQYFARTDTDRNGRIGLREFETLYVNEIAKRRF